MYYNQERYHEGSLHPPTLPKSGAGYAPPWVLLEDLAYIADNRNHTRAVSRTRDGDEIHATFFLADPPHVSYFCVSCTGSKPTEFGSEPRIVATEANLVLLAFVHGSPSNLCNREMHDYYVYQADGASDGGPSLKLLPHPDPDVFPFYTYYYFHDRQAGLLRYRTNRDGGGFTLRRHGANPYDAYIIAALCTGGTIPGTFDLCTYDSKTETWSNQLALLDQQQQHLPECPRQCEKVITIGEEAGTMGWVDLWRGIILCDVLPLKKKSPALLRYIPLPPPILPDNKLNGPATMHRDIGVVRGRIKYVEVQMHVRPVSYKPGTFVSDGWTAVTWSMAANSLEEGWHKDHEVHAHEISYVDEDNHAVAGFELLPTLRDDKGKPQPTLERIHIGHPTLSLHEDDTVYFMTKVDQGDPEAWVIALDMRNKMLRGVTKFGGAPRSLSLHDSYMHSSISGYLNMAPGTKGHLKRPGMPLPGWSGKKVPHIPLTGYGLPMEQLDAQVEGASVRADDDGDHTMNLD